ncbi:MAG: hypothetical protein JWR18_2568 [Segetibacter sp.]|jgi:hypothetical protein|nr:hypothetical protein [Segetibacter sp.]
MKKFFIASLAGIFFLAACENTGSSTVGTYEKEETSQSSEKSEGESHGEKAKEHSETTTSEGATHDTTLRTSGDAPNGASGAEIKTGANVPVDSAKSKAPQH